MVKLAKECNPLLYSILKKDPNFAVDFKQLDVTPAYHPKLPALAETSEEDPDSSSDGAVGAPCITCGKLSTRESTS